MLAPYYWRKRKFGILGLQIDDTLILANESFITKEDRELKKAKLLAKDIEKLSLQKPITFNGMTVTMANGPTISIFQEKHIATISMPQAAFNLSIAAQSVNPGIVEKIALNNCITRMKNRIYQPILLLQIIKIIQAKSDTPFYS